jgi:hypothetical protein
MSSCTRRERWAGLAFLQFFLISMLATLYILHIHAPHTNLAFREKERRCRVVL